MPAKTSGSVVLNDSEALFVSCALSSGSLPLADPLSKGLSNMIQSLRRRWFALYVGEKIWPSTRQEPWLQDSSIHVRFPLGIQLGSCLERHADSPVEESVGAVLRHIAQAGVNKAAVAIFDDGRRGKHDLCPHPGLLLKDLRQGGRLRVAMVGMAHTASQKRNVLETARALSIPDTFLMPVDPGRNGERAQQAVDEAVHYLTEALR